MTSSYQSWVVDAENSGSRLDVFLQKSSPERSRSEWSRLIEEGCVLVNSKKIQQRSFKLQVLDEVTYDQQQYKIQSQPSLEKISYTAPEILFEDELLMVINKPEGLPVHSGSGIPFEKTLAHWIQNKKYIDLGDAWPEDVIINQRWGIVHRLDMNTSGAMIIAKNAKVHRLLSEAFQNRQVHRRYYAVTGLPIAHLSKKIPPLLDKWCREGHAAFKFSNKRFSLATQYGRDPTHPLRMSPIPEGGKRAITHAYLHYEAAPHVFLEIKLQTGRTHQIRSHMRFLGSPIVGDELYGGQKWHRVLLHSHIIKFKHPISEQELEFSAASHSFFEACLQLGLRVPSNSDKLWTEY